MFGSHFLCINNVRNAYRLNRGMVGLIPTPQLRYSQKLDSVALSYLCIFYVRIRGYFAHFLDSSFDTAVLFDWTVALMKSASVPQKLLVQGFTTHSWHVFVHILYLIFLKINF